YRGGDVGVADRCRDHAASGRQDAHRSTARHSSPHGRDAVDDAVGSRQSDSAGGDGQSPCLSDKAMKTTLCMLLLTASAVLLTTDAMAQTKRPPVVGIDHVAFRTSDAAAVRAFYGELLGLAVDDRTPVLTVTINARQRVVVESGLSPETDEGLGHIPPASRAPP